MSFYSCLLTVDSEADLVSLIDSAVLVHLLRLPGNSAVFYSKYLPSSQMMEHASVQHRCSFQNIKTALLKMNAG